MISRARFMARCCSNLLGTRTSSAALDVNHHKSCCRRTTRFAPFVSADQFFPYLKSCGEVLQFASIWNRDCALTTSACSKHSRNWKAFEFITGACLKHSRNGNACAFITNACSKHSQRRPACVFTAIAGLKHSRDGKACFFLHRRTLKIIWIREKVMNSPQAHA